MAYSTRLLRPSFHPSSTPKPSGISSASPTLHFPTAIKSNHSCLSISNQTLKLAYLSTSSQSIPPLFNPLRYPQSNPFRVQMSSCQSTVVPAKDRLISIVAYLLPFLNGLSYGQELLSSFPTFEHIFEPLVPLLGFYKSIPLASLVSLCALYIGVVRDRKRFSRYVRLNALQTLLLEFISVLPSLLHIFLEFGEGLGLRLVETTNSAAFLVVLVCFAYSLVFCVFGRTPYFPVVTNAIDWRLSLQDRFL